MRRAQPAAARALSVVLTGRRLALGFLRPPRCDSGLCAMDPRPAAAVVTPAPGYRGSRPPVLASVSRRRGCGWGGQAGSEPGAPLLQHQASLHLCLKPTAPPARPDLDPHSARLSPTPQCPPQPPGPLVRRLAPCGSPPVRPPPPSGSPLTPAPAARLLSVPWSRASPPFPPLPFFSSSSRSDTEASQNALGYWSAEPAWLLFH